MEYKYNIFISYARKDFDEVNALFEKLKAEVKGIRIWFDINGVESGDEFEEKIIKAIDNSEVVLFALSDNSINSKYAKDEVIYAKNTNKRVVPVLLKGAQLKGWFLFKFGRIDCITINDNLQWNKLIENLCQWFRLERQSNIICDNSQRESPIKTYSQGTTAHNKEIESNLINQKYRNVKPSSKQVISSSSVPISNPIPKRRSVGRIIVVVVAVSFICGFLVLGIVGQPSLTDATAIIPAKTTVPLPSSSSKKISTESASLDRFDASLLESMSKSKRIAYLRRWAEQGDSVAQYNLGVMYEKGEGVAQDKVEAVKWYRKAAEQGHASAQYNLGVMYYNGDGLAQDKVESVKWYRKAAEQGHASVQYNLGVMYYNGDGVAQDKVESVKWYRKAAEQGHASAQYNLGVMYYNGDGLAQDKVEAVKWYRKAAEQGHANAQDYLGYMYYNGDGVAQDKVEAVKWYRKAAEQGYANAQNNLGVMYYNGDGLAQDKVEAVKWYRKAAEQGHASAQYNLGVMYKKGFFVKFRAVKLGMFGRF